MPITELRAALANAVNQLERAGVPNPAVDADLLAAFILNTNRGGVQAAAASGRDLSDDEALSFEKAIERRAEREPLQHITGLAPFRYLELEVGPGVFIPRPETEIVTQAALDYLRSVSPEPGSTVVDFCTGSGAIALALATERPDLHVHGVEKSAEAYAYAERNKTKLGARNLTLHLGVVADALPEFDSVVSLVISNPPYIPRAATPRDIEVRKFDPPLALYGGEDGLDVVRDLSETSKRILKPGGPLIIEHGELQGSEIRALLTHDGWNDVETHPDLTGRDRFTVAHKRIS